MDSVFFPQDGLYVCKIGSLEVDMLSRRQRSAVRALVAWMRLAVIRGWRSCLTKLIGKELSVLWVNPCQNLMGRMSNPIRAPSG